MIILYACLLLTAVFTLLPGFDLRQLARIHLRHTWLVWLALADQVIVISVLPEVGHLNNAAHLASYGLAAAFAVLNLRSAGTWVVAAGGASNLAAIVANGGTMPASPSALEASGWHAPTGHFANSAVVDQPHLAYLGDVFVTPSWLPVQSVYSIGDIVIILGVAAFLQNACRRRPDVVSGSGDPVPNPRVTPRPDQRFRLDRPSAGGCDGTAEGPLPSESGPSSSALGQRTAR